MKGGPWKCRAVDAEENQKQVFHRAHSTLEIAARFPHSHRPGCLNPLTGKNQRTQPKLDCVPRESGNRKARFPLFHRTYSLRRKEGACVSVAGDSRIPELTGK